MGQLTAADPLCQGAHVKDRQRLVKVTRGEGADLACPVPSWADKLSRWTYGWRKNDAFGHEDAFKTLRGGRGTQLPVAPSVR